MTDELTCQDLARIPIVDNHCHLFDTTWRQHDLPALINMSLNAMPPDQLRLTMIYRKLLRELRSFLDVEDAADDTVLRIREERMRSDYPKWVGDLLSHGGIDTLVVDLGYKPATQSLDEFEGLVPAKTFYMFRIESVLDDLWRKFNAGELSFVEVEERFDASLRENMANSRMVAFKTIIGYRTGIEIQPVERADLLHAAASEKAFRDYFFLQTLSRAAEVGMPVQIHASFGESNIDQRRNHPGMLKWIFDQPAFATVPMVIVHGGYPHCFEAGYLASVYPNVYVDMSEMIPFVPFGSRQGLRDIFDMCPFNKILYGSDGFVTPEIHWLGARMARDSMTALLAEYIAAGLFDRDLALEVAGMVFADNATRLYRLEEP